MTLKRLIYVVVASLSVTLLLIASKTDKRPNPPLRVFSSSPRIQPAPVPVRRFAILAVSIHSKLHSYLFYSPIVAAAWQRIGYEPIVVFTGDFTDNSNASRASSLSISRALLRRLNVRTLDLQCGVAYSVKIAQLLRIFAGFLPQTLVHDQDFVLTTDSDLIPIREGDYLIQPNTDGFVYNAFCCGTFKRRNRTYSMYPLSHVCLRKGLWRQLFLESVQQRELRKVAVSPSHELLLSARAPFVFDTISLYTRHEFGELFDATMIKGGLAWYMDQFYVSMLLSDYGEQHGNFTVDKRKKTSARLDSLAPDQTWDPHRFKNFGDAHAVHDEIFDSIRWASFRKLLFFLFNASLASEFNAYHTQFTLTLTDKPEHD